MPQQSSAGCAVCRRTLARVSCDIMKSATGFGCERNICGQTTRLLLAPILPLHRRTCASLLVESPRALTQTDTHQGPSAPVSRLRVHLYHDSAQMATSIWSVEVPLPRSTERLRGYLINGDHRNPSFIKYESRLLSTHLLAHRLMKATQYVRVAA